MLTKEQIDDVWESQISAEVRALYFGDLASLYSQRKQLITGLSFFLSSSAAATLIGKLPIWFPIVLSTMVALMSAYAVASNLDTKVRTMGKLHYAWTEIGNGYKRLWNHVYSDDAEAELQDLQRRELEVSELATTDAPYQPKRMERWQERVFQLHRLGNA